MKRLLLAFALLRLIGCGWLDDEPEPVPVLDPGSYPSWKDAGHGDLGRDYAPSLPRK
jgi:hypothetical protein